MASAARTANTCPQWRKKARVFDDPCAVHVRERQSIDTGDYQVTNFFRKCGEPVMTNCGIDQVQTWPKAWGNVYQCGVDYDSDLRYSPLTNLKNVQQLFARPYGDAGYRGAGANNLHLKDLESSLLQGQYDGVFKSMEPASENYIDRFDYLPGGSTMSPSTLEHTIQPWTRGGTNTRELVRRMSLDDYCHMLNRARPY